MQESGNFFLEHRPGVGKTGAMVADNPGILIWVPGLCKPAGSKRGFFNKKSGKVMIVDACAKSRPWKTDVKAFAAAAYQGSPLMGPVEVIMVFYMPRPKGHYNTKGEIKSSAPPYPTTRPDLLKLARGCEDAITGTIYHDDSQIISEYLVKVYESNRGPGVEIYVKETLREI